MLQVDDHPLLDLRWFVTHFDAPLGQTPLLADLTQMLKLDCSAPLASSDEIRSQVRDLLRHGGFKPTGRSKPASEYLIKAATNEKLSSINLAVDACNVVSLHNGLPISVVDLDKLTKPLRVGITEPGSTYVFNQSGQEIDIGGLLCLFDANGPCANAVKDSQRTKTNETTMRTLSLIWGSSKLAGHAAATEAWYRELLISAGARIE